MAFTNIIQGSVGTTVEVSEIETLSNGNIIIGDGSGAPTTLDAFSSSTGTLKTANGGTGLTAPGTRTIILSAAGGSPTTTIGCGGPTKVEAGTNDIDYYALEFDTTTEERAFWGLVMPDSYNGGTVTAQFIWTNASGLAAETVTWGIKALSLADDEAIDQAYGSEVTVADTFIAQGDVHISAATSAITIGGTPAGGEYVVFNVGRKTASDDLTGDARLLAVKIEYTVSSYSD